jgi:hypothetical protein
LKNPRDIIQLTCSVSIIAGFDVGARRDRKWGYRERVCSRYLYGKCDRHYADHDEASRGGLNSHDARLQALKEGSLRREGIVVWSLAQKVVEASLTQARLRW